MLGRTGWLDAEAEQEEHLLRVGHWQTWQEVEASSRQHRPAGSVHTQQLKQRRSNHPIRQFLVAKLWLILPICTLMMVSAQKIYNILRSPLQWRFAYAVELLFSIAVYLISGSATILVNKHLIKDYWFHSPIVLSNLGSAFIAVVTRIMVAAGLVKLDSGAMTWRRYLANVLPIAVCQFATNVLGVWAYNFISVPLVQIMKGTTIVLVLIVGLALKVERFNVGLVTSVLTIAAGTALAAAFEEKGGGSHIRHAGRTWVGDEKVFGIVLCLLGCASEAVRAVLTQRVMEKNSVFEALYYATPLYVLLAIASAIPTELHTHALAKLEPSGMLALFVILNILLTGLVVLSNFWVVKLTGAVGLKVIMNVRNIGLILVSVIFTGESCTVMQSVGYTVTLLGMGRYDHIRQMETSHAKGKPEDKALLK